MIRALRNISSTLILCVYIAGGALIELTHHDALSFAARSHHAFEQHDCGQHERHVDPESFRCLACTLANHRVAVEVHSSLPPKLFLVTWGRACQPVAFPFDVDVDHVGTRGPPAA